MNTAYITTDSQAIEYLGLPVDDRGELKMRSGATRPIRDLVGLANKIKYLVRDQEIRFIDTSNVNLNWIVDQGTNAHILTFSPRLTGQADLPMELAQETGFLDPGKFQKIKAISDRARLFGIPSPVWHVTEYDIALRRAWGTQEIVHGENLGDIWDELKRHEQTQILGDLARLAAKMHTMTIMPHHVDEHRHWYQRRIKMSVDWLLRHDLLEPIVYGTIIQETESLFSDMPSRPLCTTHFDILFHNIFVRQNEAHWEITGLIDWETSSMIGCPTYDALLAAWWMAGEDQPGHDPVVFSHFVKTYNQALGSPGIPTDPQALDAVLKLVDLTWYLQVLPFTHAREPQRREPRLKAVHKILNRISNSKQYLPEDFRVSLL
jgi:hypothetical protein